MYGVLEFINFNGINNLNLEKGQKNSMKFDKHVKLFCEIISAKLSQFVGSVDYDEED